MVISDEGGFKDQATSGQLVTLASGTATTTVRFSFAESGDEGGVGATFPASGTSQQAGSQRMTVEAENLAVDPFVARKWSSLRLIFLV